MISPDGRSCEFALVIADEWRHRGIAHKLMKSLVEAARAKGLKTMEGEVLAENRDMLILVGNLGFSVESAVDEPSLKYVRKIL